MNWISSWNEWSNYILNWYLPFLMKSPLFCLFWTLIGQFLGTFPIRPVSMIPWLLIWIIFWNESFAISLNWIIFWIKPWVKQYWIEYWMNHFWQNSNIELSQIGYRTPLTHALYWPSAIKNQPNWLILTQHHQAPTIAVLYWPSTQLDHLVVHSWAKFFSVSVLL